MRFFTKKVQGSISLFLVMIMLPMFVLAGLIVDGARISAARMSVSGAGDLALNAALSEYDKILHDVYGLFAMSSNMEELQTNINMYFSNTINNTGLLQSSDSYTRSFFNSIGSMFSGDDISFDNIVDTEVESFNMVTVANSSIANPSVMKRQIVEYMKIRGPVNLGTSLLTKLGCIGETSKQNKVVKAKVQYDKKLKSVQEACETAYAAINAFNDNVNASNFSHTNYLTELNTALGTSRDKTYEMVRRIIASRMKKYNVKQVEFDSDYDKNTVKPVYENATDEDDPKLAKYVAMVSFMNGLITDSANTRLANWSFGPTGDDPFMAERQMIDEMNNGDNFALDTKIYTAGRVAATIFQQDSYLSKSFKGLTDEQKETAEYKDVYTALSGRVNTTFAARLSAKDFQAGWKSAATTYGREACQVLYDDWYSKTVVLIGNLSDAITALETVKTKAGELRTVKADWKNRLDDLSESDIKTSLEGDYNNCAQQISVDVVDALIAVLSKDKDHFTQIKDQLDNIKFGSEKIIWTNYGSKDYESLFRGKVQTSADDTREVEVCANEEMSARYQGVTGDNISAGLTQTTFRKITESDDQFYQFLTNTCGSNATNDDDKKAATEERDALVNKANQDATSLPSTEGMNTGSYSSDSGLPDEIRAAIDTLAASGVCDNTFNATKIESGSDDSMADNASSNLSSISSLLDGLASIAGSAAETVYLEEYITEMFSCYTTGLGDRPVTTSLSKADLQLNKFYRSEAEYILWGNDSVDANIAATVALIFGIRFALNSIFAFTNSNTRTPALTAATAIAGWTGFGVPIVQSVILLATALAESIIDVGQLCEGKDVVIYKTWDKWMTGPSGAKDALKNMADLVIDSVFDKIQEKADSAIDELVGDIEEYANSTIKGVQESVVSSVSNSFQTLIISVVGESNYNLTEADIAERVNSMIQGLRDSCSGSGVMANAMDAAATILEGKASTISSKLYQYYNEAKTGTTHKVKEILEKILDETITGPLESAISSALASAKESLKNEADRIIQEGGDKVKEELNGAIDDFLGSLGQGGGGAATSSSTVSAAVALTLNYKEYLKIFVLLNMLGNEEKMLNRCAKLIQINIREKNPSFDISKAYTMAQINSTVTIRTTFFDVPVSTGVDASGNPTYDLDFSNIGTGRQRINYVGILGY